MAAAESARKLKMRREPQQRAIAELFDVLEQHYSSVLVPGARPSISDEKVIAAAGRIREGAPSDADRAALAAMPAGALQAFGHSGEAFIVATATLFENPGMSAKQLAEVAAKENRAS